MRQKHIVTIIILALLLVMVGDFRINKVEMFGNYAKQMETDSMKELNNFQSPDFDSKHADKNINMNIPKKDFDSLFMKNSMGSINIIGEKRKDIEVKANIIVYADTVNRAQEFLSELELTKEITNENILEIKLPKKIIPEDINGVKVNYNIKAPQELVLNLNNNFGPLSVEDFNNKVILSNYYDKLTVKDIKGPANLKAKYGGMYVNKIENDAEIEVDYSKTDIRNIKGNLNLKSSFSETSIEEIEGKIDITGKYGGVNAKRINNDLNIKTRFSGIQLDNIDGNLKADLEYGECNINDFKGNADIKTEFADINFIIAEEVKGLKVDGSSEYGNINTNLPLKVSSQNNIKKISGQTGNGEYNIKIKSKHGDLLINKR